MLVNGVTKLKKVETFTKDEQKAENIRKILLAMSEDIRVIIIKLADRLHNMRTLQFQPPEKQKKIAKETRDVYAPIAHRLGLSQVKTELEDLSLFYLEREKFEEIENLLSRQSTNMKNAIDVLKNKIVEILTPTNILFEITSRVKSIYSIYKKMYVKGKAFDDIYDIMALRIITETEMNCYELLGYIHANFKPIPGRFKDYIAMPKPNMYQSLHTTIVTGDGHTFEIQIRTKKMDEIAEEGVAAHWRYKENKKYDAKTEQQEIEEQLHWFRDFVSVTNEIQDGNAKEYVEALQHDIFDANVYVFTPKGKVVTLPNGSTPIDFAYKIHTDVGNTLAGAKVNNQMVPISRVLQTGDVVEIITNKNATPNSEWLNMATSSIAKSHIRKFLMKQNSDFIRQDNIQKGRNSLAVSFRERKIKANIDKIMTKKLFEHFNVENADELYLLLNSKTIMPLNIIEYLGLERSQEETLDDLKNNVNKRNVNRNIQDAVTLENGDRSLISLASCCTPIPGDDIIGYITKGNGIKVHRVSCPNVCQEHNRLIPVIWNSNAEKKDYPVDISIECYDRNNLLIDVLNCFSQIKVQVYKVNAKYHASNNTTTISVTVMVKDVAYLNTLTQQLLNINSVYDIRRVIH